MMYVCSEVLPVDSTEPNYTHKPLFFKFVDSFIRFWNCFPLYKYSTDGKVTHYLLVENLCVIPLHGILQNKDAATLFQD